MNRQSDRGRKTFEQGFGQIVKHRAQKRGGQRRRIRADGLGLGKKRMKGRNGRAVEGRGPSLSVDGKANEKHRLEDRHGRKPAEPEVFFADAALVNEAAKRNRVQKPHSLGNERRKLKQLGRLSRNIHRNYARKPATSVAGGIAFSLIS